ncbi:uncharacterized protein G2W53_005268 [Senna tora]|uniref:Uncharacterized protein n=1 Tax=Senna tora TaxID=362788 RepID=A0A835CK27_9FABA|nr:uncharacterized protein G2W53_005268 [Senna tora]
MSICAESILTALSFAVLKTLTIFFHTCVVPPSPAPLFPLRRILTRRRRRNSHNLLRHLRRSPAPLFPLRRIFTVLSFVVNRHHSLIRRRRRNSHNLIDTCAVPPSPALSSAQNPHAPIFFDTCAVQNPHRSLIRRHRRNSHNLPSAQNIIVTARHRRRRNTHNLRRHFSPHGSPAPLFPLRAHPFLILTDHVLRHYFSLHV